VVRGPQFEKRWSRTRNQISRNKLQMETVVADSGKCPFSNAILTIFELIFQTADSGGLADKGAGLRVLASWDFGFESRRGHGCFCLL